MHAALAIASLASLASLASAAAAPGYGRFPCFIVNGDITDPDVTFQADPSQCVDLIPTGDGSGFTQADGNTPVGAECVLDANFGRYFCGIAGATCTDGTQCDNGLCVNGQCQGGFSQDCDTTAEFPDSTCSGLLYCGFPDGSGFTTCGGIGAFCGDALDADLSAPVADQVAVFSRYCQPGAQCSSLTQGCIATAALGESCAEDPEYQCGEGLTPSSNDDTCVCTQVTPSARARSRRSANHRRNLCPASHTACSVGTKGFECIDVSSNIEQCGACASQGGVDCSAIEGAESVGCVQGVCEIWSCQDGFTYDASSSACVRA
ncbi:uncharacterized protein JCM10292_006637 [Rhodotorula paludigena]|uniref:uncharacterized protein n=1 Tax=Rhodotorula paludigena TaxID=86838 RepID=UPI00317A9E55